MADGSARRPAPAMAVRAAQAQPATLDAEAREVEVVFSTGARAWNYVPGEGHVWEELDMSPDAVRMGRLSGGDAPVLDSHRGYGVGSVLGRVVSARLEGGQGVARLRFSAADDVASAWQKIQDGTLRTVSVGYQIHAYEKSKDPDGRTVVRATDWEPYEISVVPIPADAGATVRGELVADAPAAIPDNAARAANQESVAMAENANAAPEAPAAVQTVDVEAERAAAAAAERQRIAGVEAVLRAASAMLPAAEIEALRGRAIESGMTAEGVRAAAFDAASAAARGGANAPAITSVQVGASGDDPAAIIDAMGDALAVRIRSSFRPASERHREWSGVRISEMFRELLAARGERNVPRAQVALAERAFHTTSDFPLLLSNAMNKVLAADYQQATPTYRQFMARRTFNDFKPHSFLRVGDFPALAALSEGAEITFGTISEGREQVTLATYARGVRVTRQMLVNDDLGAFNDFGAMIGRRVTDFENATAFALLNTGNGAGPNLADGTALFATGATRRNRASSGAAIDVTTVGSAVAAMAEQTSLDGLKLNLSPRFILTGTAGNLSARQLVASVAPTKREDVNPWSGAFEPIMDANVPGNRWYMFADPAVAPVFVYGYLAGAEGPQVRTGTPMGTDGVQIEVVLDFACGAIDFRGAYFNPGAA